MAQATAFGLKSVVGVPGLDMDAVGALSSFCEKASTVSNGELASLFISTNWKIQRLVLAFADHVNLENDKGLDVYGVDVVRVALLPLHYQ
jgi:hypothetical protein